MTSNFFNIIALFLSLIIVGTVIASPVDRPKKNFDDLLLTSILDLMNNGHSNYSFPSGTLLKKQDISAEDDPLIYIVSVLVKTDSDEYPQLTCYMVVKVNASSSNFIVDKQSIQCSHYEEKKGTTAIFCYDTIILQFLGEVIGKPDKYKIPGKLFDPFIVNATAEDIPDGTKYVIYFVIIGPTCVTSGITTSCSTQADRLARLCTVIGEEKHKLKNPIRHIDATCEKEQYDRETMDRRIGKIRIYP